MTPLDIQNYGAGIAALAVVFWSYATFVKSLKPLIEKLNIVVHNNTEALNESRKSTDNIAKALELLEFSIGRQTDTFDKKLTEHDCRSIEIHEDIKEMKALTREIKTKIYE